MLCFGNRNRLVFVCYCVYLVTALTLFKVVISVFSVGVAVLCRIGYVTVLAGLPVFFSVVFKCQGACNCFFVTASANVLVLGFGNFNRLIFVSEVFFLVAAIAYQGVSKSVR